MNKNWITYEELSAESKRSLEAYSFQTEKPLYKMIKDKLFAEVHYPVKSAIKLCVSCTPDLKQDFITFENYHYWYKKNFNLPSYNDSLWPCIIEEGEDGWLSDGWIRFHSYVDKGEEFIPVLHIKNTAEVKYRKKTYRGVA